MSSECWLTQVATSVRLESRVKDWGQNERRYIVISSKRAQKKMSLLFFYMCLFAVVSDIDHVLATETDVELKEVEESSASKVHEKFLCVLSLFQQWGFSREIYQRGQ